MTTQTLTPGPFAPHVKEARYDLLSTLRQPGFTLPTLLFPATFYLFFGILFGQGNGLALYLLPTYGVFGVIGAALFGFGASIAVARESGELRLKRASPMPAAAFFGAKVTTSLTFSVVILLELFVLAATLGDVVLGAGQWLLLASVLLAGTVPFAAVGLAVGSYASGKGAPALLNLIYLPSAFLSGLWIPIEVLPSLVGRIALFLPPYHLGQLALRVVGKGAGQPVALHVGALLFTTLVALPIAARGLRRDDA